MQSLNGLKKVSNYFIGGSGWQSQEEKGIFIRYTLKTKSVEPRVLYSAEAF